MNKRLEVILIQEDGKISLSVKRSANLDRTTAKTMINKLFASDNQAKINRVLNDLPVRERDTFNG